MIIYIYIYNIAYIVRSWLVPGPWMFAFLELASTYGLRSWPLRLPQSASWLRHCDTITICDGWRPRFRFTVQKPCDAWIRANPALERQTGRWNSLIETLPSSWGSTFSSSSNLPSKSSPILIRYGYGSIPINTIFSGMNIHLPSFTSYFDVNYRGTGFWPIPISQWYQWPKGIPQRAEVLLSLPNDPAGEAAICQSLRSLC